MFKSSEAVFIETEHRWQARRERAARPMDACGIGVQDTGIHDPTVNIDIIAKKGEKNATKKNVMVHASDHCNDKPRKQLGGVHCTRDLHTVIRM